MKRSVLETYFTGALSTAVYTVKEDNYHICDGTYKLLYISTYFVAPTPYSHTIQIRYKVKGKDNVQSAARW